MHDLTLVGVHDDGEHLLVVAADGQRYRLRVDEALRAAVRRDRARLGQLQIEMEGRLRPRDIQARIRAGHTAEEVAEAAGLPLAHIRRYEGPVLAEREYVADQARRVPVRRSAPGTPGSPTLSATVAERLTRREVDPAAAEWDAWREDDGRWTVQVVFLAGARQRHARWSYDPTVRHIQPLDDEARWLTDTDPPEEGPIPHRRLSAVSEPVFDVEVDVPGVAVPGGAPEDESGEERAPAARESTPSTVELLDTLRARRGRRPRSAAGEEKKAPTTDAVDDALGSLLSRAEVAGEQDPGPNHPARRGVRRDEPEVVQLPDDAPVPVGAGVIAPDAAPDGAAHDGDDRGPARKSRRASVPSWDDIVFGARRD